MAKFLAKSKAGPPMPPTRHEEAESTDFDRVFKPFALRKGVEVAPTNCYGTREGVEENPIVVLDSGAPLSPSPAPVIRSPPVSLLGVVRISVSCSRFTNTTLQDRLQDIISSLPPPNPSGHQIQNSYFKDPVRTILNELAEAEVAGEISTTRSLLDLLGDRSVIPAKIFIFHEDTRPGYFGTWTRISSAIRPRRPFARDVVAIDYSYDSSEEWEEDSPGDADDVADDDDDDDELDAGEDSDIDSWLVDDNDDGDGDEGDVEAVSPVDEVDPAPHSKRPLEGAGGAGTPYKKRRVVRLVPFVKGPIWDPAIVRTPEMFAPFRLRFFNGMWLVAQPQARPLIQGLDNPCPMDPFTYVSPLGMPTQAAISRTFLVPAIPERVQSASNVPQPSTPGVAKKHPKSQKFPFPEAHVPTLVAKINELATGSIILIVETLYQELKDHKVKKNSIEAKVKELAVKKGRIWVAKQNAH